MFTHTLPAAQVSYATSLRKNFPGILKYFTDNEVKIENEFGRLELRFISKRTLSIKG